MTQPYGIYQVKPEYLQLYGFRALEYIRRDRPGWRGLPREAWRLVYVLETEQERSLDWLYVLFNGGGEAWPPGFTGRSMSVSDIIEKPDGTLWFCDSKGWQQVKWEEDDGD